MTELYHCWRDLTENHPKGQRPEQSGTIRTLISLSNVAVSTEYPLRCHSARFVRDSLLIQEVAEGSKPVWPIPGEVVDGRVTPIRENSQHIEFSEENQRMPKTTCPDLRLQNIIVNIGNLGVVPGRVIQTLLCILPVLFQVPVTL